MFSTRRVGGGGSWEFDVLRFIGGHPIILVKLSFAEILSLSHNWEHFLHYKNQTSTKVTIHGRLA